jgi:hypothetical protein
MKTTKPKKYALRSMSRKFAIANNLEHIFDDGNSILAFKMQNTWYPIDIFRVYVHSAEPYVTKAAYNETVFSAVIIDEIDINGDWVIAHCEHC